MLKRIATTFTHFKAVSPARSCLIKADGLMEHGHLEDALEEAKKARDQKGATCHEIKIAKGKIVDILEKEKSIPNINKKSKP